MICLTTLSIYSFYILAHDCRCQNKWYVYHLKEKGGLTVKLVCVCVFTHMVYTNWAMKCML